MRIEYHRTLIADRVRNEALRAAMTRVIRKGETVVADIGAGTGLLGLMAAQLGAKEVFLYEAAEVAGVAAQVLKVNRTRNCHLMPCHSTEMQDPPRVDLVVSETLGNYAFEENIIDTLNDARDRFLKPCGVILPARVTQFVAPVTTNRIHRELTAWDDAASGLDLSPARIMSLNNAYVRTFEPHDLLEGGASAVAWDTVSFDKKNKSNRKGEANWHLSARGTIFGFAYWWEAGLIDDIVLSTAPGAPRTHWEQLYFPLLEPLACARGDDVAIVLRSRSSEQAGTHLAWTAIHRGANGETKSRQAMDLDKGWIP